MDSPTSEILPACASPSSWKPPMSSCRAASSGRRGGAGVQGRTSRKARRTPGAPGAAGLPQVRAGAAVGRRVGRSSTMSISKSGRAPARSARRAASRAGRRPARGCRRPASGRHGWPRRRRWHRGRPRGARGPRAGRRPPGCRPPSPGRGRGRARWGRQRPAGCARGRPRGAGGWPRRALPASAPARQASCWVSGWPATQMVSKSARASLAGPRADWMASGRPSPSWKPAPRRMARLSWQQRGLGLGDERRHRDGPGADGAQGPPSRPRRGPMSTPQPRAAPRRVLPGTGTRWRRRALHRALQAPDDRVIGQLGLEASSRRSCGRSGVASSISRRRRLSRSPHWMSSMTTSRVCSLAISIMSPARAAMAAARSWAAKAWSRSGRPEVSESSEGTDEAVVMEGKSGVTEASRAAETSWP